MPKRKNMGRKSHQVQDAQLKQNAANIPDEIGRQPTRPSIRKQQATKASEQPPRKVK